MTAGSLAICKKHSNEAFWFVRMCLSPNCSVRLGRPAKDEESVECEYVDCTTIATHRVFSKESE